MVWLLDNLYPFWVIVKNSFLAIGIVCESRWILFFIIQMQTFIADWLSVCLYLCPSVRKPACKNVWLGYIPSVIKRQHQKSTLIFHWYRLVVVSVTPHVWSPLPAIQRADDGDSCEIFVITHILQFVCFMVPFTDDDTHWSQWWCWPVMVLVVVVTIVGCHFQLVLFYELQQSVWTG